MSLGNKTRVQLLLSEKVWGIFALLSLEDKIRSSPCLSRLTLFITCLARCRPTVPEILLSARCVCMVLIISEAPSVHVRPQFSSLLHQCRPLGHRGKKD